MRYDLIITAINNEHANTVLARNIAHRKSISLQNALMLIYHPPVTFLENVPLNEIETISKQLSKIGVKYELKESKIIEETGKSEQKKDTQSSYNYNVQLTSSAFDHKYQKNWSKVSNHNDYIEEKKNLRKKILSVAGYILILLIPILLVYVSLDQERAALFYKIPSSMLHSAKESSGAANSKKENKKKTKSSATEADKKRAENYVDSAKASLSDNEIAVKFYKLAISFNRKNYNAWYGLINTYYEMKKIEEAHQAEEEMKNEFGENILSTAQIVKPYGTLNTTQMNQDGVYYVEYKTRAKNKEMLMFESYRIIKALKTNCDCKTISLFASRSPGTGMIVHINQDAQMSSIDEFATSASFTYLQ